MVAEVVTPVSTPPLVAEAVGLTDRPYQKEGINFLWNIRRGMNTDAPGLGKTPQGALAAEVPCMVICPTYLVQQWGDWIKAHLPKRTVVVCKGSREEKINLMLKPADFLIMNKEMLRTHKREILVIAKRFRIKTVIFDESHHLRNRGTTAAISAVDLARLVPRVYELTATPIWKEVDDLYMQLRILHPDLFSSYNLFVEDWCVADHTRFGTKVLGVKKEMIPALQEMLDAIRIGRTYEQAGRDLPPIIENVMKLSFDPAERKRYDDAVTTYRLKFENEPDLFMMSYIEVMHTLRQLTAAEKAVPILETIEDSKPYHNDKYIVFTWYKDFAERLAQAIPGAILINGDMAPSERVKQAARQRPIITTISSLSEGVDLSWARMVLFAEEHWPPGSQVQSLARVRRERLAPPVQYDGQLSEWDNILMKLDARAANEAPILVYYTVVENSIDETIHNTTRRRSATIKQVMSEALGIY